MTKILDLVDIDAVRRNVSLIMDDCPMVVLHPAIHLKSISLDLSQWLAELFSHLNYWSKIAFVADYVERIDASPTRAEDLSPIIRRTR